MKAQQNILIIDDQQYDAESSQLAIETLLTYAKVKVVTSGKAALEALERKEYQLALVDLQMPEMDGIQLCEKMNKQFPRVKKIIISINTQPEIIQKMYKELGIYAYVPRYLSLKETIYAIEEVLSGEKYYPKEIEKLLKIETPFSKISKREREILNYIAKGFSEIQIAEKLFISEKTVKSHKRHIREKLGIKNINEMVKELLRSKWLSSDDLDKQPPFQQID